MSLGARMPRLQRHPATRARRLSATRIRQAPVPPGRQRGIALLVAILLVALGTIIAAAIGYENAMAARRSTATFAFDQNLLIAQGAEALAAYGLREVKRASPATMDLSQPWAKPVGPLEIVPGVMLDAALEDVSGRFNINRLVKDDGTGQPNKAAVDAFVNLLQILQIETKWAGYIVDWIDPDIQPGNPDGAEDSVYLGQTPPYLVPNRYITSTSELLALPGFGRERYAKLAPYITALPPDVTVNVCTASGPVLDAFMAGQRSFSLDPETLEKNRTAAGACFPRKNTDYKNAFQSPADFNNAQGEFRETSNYFRLTSHVTIGTAEFNLYSLMFQEATGTVRPIQRSFSPD